MPVRRRSRKGDRLRRSAAPEHILQIKGTIGPIAYEPASSNRRGLLIGQGRTVLRLNAPKI